MRCTHCGADIPEDQMFCPECGAEVQIVPDYNPLDDVLAREVKGSVEGATRQLETDSLRRYRRSSTPQNVNSTRVLSEGELGRIRGEAGREYGRPGERGRQGGQQSGTGRMRQEQGSGRVQRNPESGRGRQTPEDVRRSQEERRRRQMKRKQAARRRRRNLLIFLFAMLVLIALGVYVIYQNSYTGVVRKGYRALQSDSYTEAENYFNRAITKDESRAEA